MGPSLLFDKSFLQCLSIDEAVMLDQLYQCVITPVFFAETLADLGKDHDDRRPPEKIVWGLAERTPVCHSAMNASHWALAQDDLAGGGPDLSGRPVVPGGKPVEVDGKVGVVFEQSPEAQAFQRWQEGRFGLVERLFANEWRAALGSVDLAEIAAVFKAQLRKEERPRSLIAAKALAAQMLEMDGVNFRSLQLAMHLLNVPENISKWIISQWKKAGRQPLRRWAPYAAHCVEVDLFFYLSMSNGLISDQRASNVLDIAYLYYLPFARVFASSDKLHRNVAPLFMNDRQCFVWGPDLKHDLSVTDAHFASLPEQERAKGLFLLAAEPPPSAELITSHWDAYRKGWRKKPRFVDPVTLSPEAQEKILAWGRSTERVPSGRSPHLQVPRDPEHLTIQRLIPRVRGKWRMFSEEVEQAEDKGGN